LLHWHIYLRPANPSLQEQHFLSNIRALSYLLLSFYLSRILSLSLSLSLSLCHFTTWSFTHNYYIHVLSTIMLSLLLQIAARFVPYKNQLFLLVQNVAFCWVHDSCYMFNIWFTLYLQPQSYCLIEYIIIQIFVLIHRYVNQDRTQTSMLFCISFKQNKITTYLSRKKNEYKKFDIRITFIQGIISLFSSYCGLFACIDLIWLSACAACGYYLSSTSSCRA
jgi:hypothetical protein